jgi:predicted transcriptional regulator
MGEVKKLEFDDDSAPILDQEDEATLAAIDRGIKAADEGREVPMEEVGRRMEQWTTRSSSPKTASRS